MTLAPANMAHITSLPPEVLQQTMQHLASDCKERIDLSLSLSDVARVCTLLRDHAAIAYYSAPAFDETG